MLKIEALQEEGSKQAGKTHLHCARFHGAIRGQRTQKKSSLHCTQTHKHISLHLPSNHANTPRPSQQRMLPKPARTTCQQHIPSLDSSQCHRVSMDSTMLGTCTSTVTNMALGELVSRHPTAQRSHSESVDGSSTLFSLCLLQAKYFVATMVFDLREDRKFASGA